MDDRDTLFDLPLGEMAKERGQLAAGSSDRAWDWRHRAEAAIYDLAAAGLPFTADDVVAVVGLPDSGQNRNNSVGATFSACRKRGWIVQTGTYRKSRRVLSRARIIAVWAGNPDHDFFGGRL